MGEFVGISAIGAPMSLVHILPMGFALAACVLPVLLLTRRPGSAPSPAILRNAWSASLLRMSVLVPLFALGATGEVRAGLAGVMGFGVGLLLLGLTWRRVAIPRDEAPSGGGVRSVAAIVSVVALFGLVGAEAAAFVIVATSVLGEGAGIPVFVGLVGGAGLHALAAGRVRIVQASQALLAAILIGLFGSTVFLLYLSASDLRPMPPHGAFGLVALAACCIAILAYRQTKYVETPLLVAPDEASRWRRVLARQTRLLQRFANVVISVLAVVVVVIVGMELYVLGVPEIARSALAALGTASRLPVIGLVAIALLALAHPLVDAMSRQSAAALGEAASPAGLGPTDGPARRAFGMVAGETALLGLLVLAFGAVAALATDLPPDALGIADFVRQLVAFEHGITDAALSLLLVGCVAMAVSTMSMTIAAAMAVIRRDVAPALRPGLDGAAAPDRMSTGLALVGLAGSAAIWIASGVPSAGIADARFFALSLVFVCLQLSLLPLVLARLLDLPPAGAGLSLATLGAGAAASLACIAAWAGTGDTVWLWTAVPACLLAGLLPLAAAWRRG